MNMNELIAALSPPKPEPEPEVEPRWQPPDPTIRIEEASSKFTEEDRRDFDDPYRIGRL